MFRNIFLLSVLGVALAAIKERRFLYQDGQGSFPNSPFGGSSGGMTSPFGSGGQLGSGTSTGYSPCIPTQSMCSLQCDGGYVKGPSGCDFCMCNSHAQQGTTLGPVFVDPVDGISSTATPALQVSTQSQTVTTSSASVDCATAHASCATTCGEKGYLVDPSDCTFCLCKNTM